MDNRIEWCQINNLFLNVSKTKMLIVDFRKGKQMVDASEFIGETVWRESLASGSWPTPLMTCPGLSILLQ